MVAEKDDDHALDSFCLQNENELNIDAEISTQENSPVEYDPDEEWLKKDEELEKATETAIIKTEKIILSIILNKGLMSDDITESLFSDPINKEVHKGIFHYTEKSENKEFDANAVGLLLSVRRHNAKWKDDIIPDLKNLTSDGVFNLDNYLLILKEELFLIKSKKIALKIIENVSNRNLSYMETASKELASMGVAVDNTYSNMNDAMDSAVFELQEKIASSNAISGITTGLPTLDDVIGGFQLSDLVIVAARPGQGKTALAINFAYNSNESCGFISSEMPLVQLSNRFLSLDSGVDAQKIRDPKKLSDTEIKKVLASSVKLKNEKELYIIDKASMSIQEVRAIATIWKEKYDIKLLFLDYLQRLIYRGAGYAMMPKNERVGLIAQEAKEIGRDLKLAVIALAQLGRSSERHEDKASRPMLSDLKDSGMLEQEADLVICPFRQNVTNSDVNVSEDMLLLILKNRHGPLGDIAVRWIPKIMKITEDFEDEEAEELASDNIEPDYV